MKLSRSTIYMLCVFSLPFVLRFLFALEIYRNDYLGSLGVLGRLNHTFALDILESKGAPYFVFRSPFYPLIISCLYRLFGASPWVIRIVQWIAGGLCCWLIYYIASRCFNRRTGIIALIAASCYVPFVHFESLLVAQPLATFFVTASIACMLPFIREGKRNLLCIAGALLYGIGFLLRPALLLALPFFLITLWMTPRETYKKKYALVYFCLTLCAMIYLLFHPGKLLDIAENHISINASINLYLGNNAQADGITPVFHDIPHIRSDHPDARKHHISELTLASIMHAKAVNSSSLADTARFWRQKTVGSILSNPIHFIGLMVKKCLLFFNGFIVTNQRDIYFTRSYSWLLCFLLFNLIICFPLGIIIPFFVIGLTANQPIRRIQLLLLAVPAGCLLTTLLFFHAHRFQIPAMPFFLIFAGNGIAWIWDCFRQKEMRKHVKKIILFAAVLLIANHNFFGSHTVRREQEEFNVGSFYFNAQQYDLAEDHFKKSLSYDAEYIPSILNLASTYIRTQKYDEGLTYFLQVQRTANEVPWAVPYNITQLLFAAGQLDEAKRWGIQTCQSFPDHPECYNLLGSIYFQQSDFSNAEQILIQGINRFPHASQLLSNLGSVLLMQQNYPEAIALLTRSLHKTTSYPEPFYLLGTAYYQSGDYSKAQHIMEQGAALFEEYPDMWFLLIQIYIRTNQSKLANTAFNWLLTLTESNKEVAFQIAQRFMQLKQYRYARTFAHQAKTLGMLEADSLLQELPAQ